MRKNILVSGSHRSGSTWTGYVIAQARNMRYVHEPFNVGFKRKNSPFKYWFEYLSKPSPEMQKKAEDYLESFYFLFHRQVVNNLSDVNSFYKGYRYAVDIFKRLTCRSVMKDPIAILSAEWIYKTFEWDIVIVIRHPAAFVASLKAKNWQFEFSNFTQQPQLMDTYLTKYASQVNDYAINKKDIIDQGILLWNIIHDVILVYKEKYGSKWYFVRHEDLSINPIPEFQAMFSYLHLKMNKNVEKYIMESTNSEVESGLERNAKDNIKSWKNRLSPEEITRIKEETENVWRKFYSEEDW